MNLLYEYPSLIFYIYYFKKTNKTLAGWKNYIKASSYYSHLIYDHPIKIFVDTMEKYEK